MSRKPQGVSHFELHPQLANDTQPVTHLPLCEVLLMDNANHPWLILVPRVANAVELIDLDETQQAELMREIAIASRVLQSTFRPYKLNVAALGNIVSQLHVHVIARFEDDIAWPRPVWGSADARPYPPETLIDRVQRLRDAFGA